MAEPVYERRLIERVHALWQQHATGGLPKPSQFRPEDFGTDWWNCFTIDLTQTPVRFSYVGKSLQNSALPVSVPELAEYARGSLLELISRQIPRAAGKKAPLGFGGQVLLNEGELLYRAILLPLSENGERVDSLLGAVAFREVVAEQQAPRSDIAWCNREIAERGQMASRLRPRSDASEN